MSGIAKMPPVPQTVGEAAKQAFYAQTAVTYQIAGPMVLDVMGGLTVKKDPYTEVHYHTEGGATTRQQAISFLLLVVTGALGYGYIEGWATQTVAGYPLAAYSGGLLALFIAYVVATVEPVRVVRDVQYLGGVTDAFATLWNAGQNCVICEGPLVVATGGLRCRECGRGHSYLGKLADGDNTLLVEPRGHEE